MLINVCPAAMTRASRDRVWDLLTTPERYADWNDATYVASEPPGPVEKDQVIYLEARALGRRWRFEMRVKDVDPAHRWLAVEVRLPFGIENQERITLSDAEQGTLVRLN